MNRTIQNGLIGLFRAVKTTGVLDTPLGGRLFEASYGFYKARFEAGSTRSLRRWVRPETVVIDVGANVGFFTLQFGSWVAEGGKVIALEPEAVNYARLRNAVARAGLDTAVETIQAAVAETSGQGTLEVNPGHPGDHKLATQGVPVTLITIDDLLAERHWPEVSFIKIDVQGAEARVLAGAVQTLERFRPVLFLEMDDQGLRRYGSSAAEVLAFTAQRGYTVHRRIGDDLSPPLDRDEVLAIAGAGYEDFLMLPAGREAAAVAARGGAFSDGTD